MQNKRNTWLSGSIILLSLFCCHPSAAQNSETVQKQFRDFYTPLLPRLQANYSNVKFVVARAMPAGPETRITCIRGAFQGTRYVYDEFSPAWILHRDPDFETIKRTYDRDLPLRSSGGWNPDYQFKVWYEAGSRRIEVFDDRRMSSDSDAYILAPMASLSLEMTYADIMNADFKFQRFVDRKSRNGTPVKTLFYRPGGNTKFHVFEADFNPTTGACVSAKEYGYDIDFGLRGPFEIQVKYAEPTAIGDELPKPSIITGNHILADPTFVLEYERVGKLSLKELSMEALGFDESVVLKEKSPGEDIDSRRTFPLNVVKLIYLLGIVAILALLTGRFVKSRSSNSKSGDSGTSTDLSE